MAGVRCGVTRLLHRVAQQEVPAPPSQESSVEARGLSRQCSHVRSALPSAARLLRPQRQGWFFKQMTPRDGVGSPGSGLSGCWGGASTHT